MNLSDCYRVLGLRTGASFAEIKAAYRRLARRYHPDVNPDNQIAQDKFIQVTAAYRQLSDTVPRDDVEATETGTARATPPPRSRPQVQANPQLSALEQQLKQSSYEQLQDLLTARKYPRAIALVDGLAQRMTDDVEVRQWQAITYQRWGRQLITDGNFKKAQVYLNKALQTDPHNLPLQQEVQRDLARLEQVFN